MTESFTVSTVIPASPLRVYEAWLDGREHGAFTGAKAEVEPGIGGSVIAWDGYIRGRTLELSEGRRILQAWRTTEFPTEAEDSLLEILLEDAPAGTRLVLRHTGIPDGQGKNYEQGWVDYYFEPMKRYFGPKRTARPTAAARKKPRKAAAKAPARKKPGRAKSARARSR